MEEIEFTREKISAHMKTAKHLFSDINVMAGSEGDDVIHDLWTTKIEGYVLSNMAEKRTLTYWCPKPTFKEWLFGRSKKVEFDLEVKDLLLNPPKLKNTERIYIPTLIEDETNI